MISWIDIGVIALFVFFVLYLIRGYHVSRMRQEQEKENLSDCAEGDGSD